MDKLGNFLPLSLMGPTHVREWREPTLYSIRGRRRGMERFDPPGDHKHFPSFISAVVFLCAYLVLSRIFREYRKRLCSSFPFLLRFRLRVAVAFLHMVKAVPNRLTGLDYPSLPSSFCPGLLATPATSGAAAVLLSHRESCLRSSCRTTSGGGWVIAPSSAWRRGS
jgi:hypothetical protein